jgi:hypothetical protein
VQLSPHFSLDEFTRTDQPFSNAPTLAETIVLQATAQKPSTKPWAAYRRRRIG